MSGRWTSVLSGISSSCLAALLVLGVAGCDVGPVGGCDISEDNPLTTAIDFYYPPMTAADAQAECAQDGGNWTPI